MECIENSLDSKRSMSSSIGAGPGTMGSMTSSRDHCSRTMGSSDVSMSLLFQCLCTWRYNSTYRYACTYGIVVPMLMYWKHTPIVLVLIHVEIQSYIRYACHNGIRVPMRQYCKNRPIVLVFNTCRNNPISAMHVTMV